ncbi:MAG: extracellular solute-binding protein [Alphaproteobacteria bacterium]
MGLLLSLGAAPAAAQDRQHAIAMHGAPKHGPEFTHFDYANPDAPKGGTLTLAETGTFDSLNPFIIRGIPAAGRHLVFESLMARGRNEPFTLYARIAQSVTIPEDRSWVEFHLNPMARFSDGQPVTIDDVIFSLETLRDNGRPNHHAYYSQVDRYERIGTHGIRMTFKAGGDRELPLILGLMPVLPKHHFDNRNFDQVSLDPIPGSGPYMVEAVDPGRSITYRYNPDHWGKDLPVNRGHFNFATIRFDYYRDESLAFEAFRAGQADFRGEPSPQRWATGYARRDDDVILAELRHGRPSGMLGLVMNTRKPVFADKRVRDALINAFNFEWTNAKLFHGAYKRTESYFDNSELEAPLNVTDAERSLAQSLNAGNHPALEQDLTSLPVSNPNGYDRHNLRRAQQLLTEAGYRVDKGKLVDTSGTQLSFEILITTAGPDRAVTQFSRDLERLGIDANVRLVDEAQYQARVTNYDFDMIAYFWGQSLSPGHEQSFYWSSASADQPGTRNYMGVKDPLIDELVERIPAAETRDELVTATRLLDRVLRQGDYVIPLYHLDVDRIAYWERLQRPETIPAMGNSIDIWWSR